MGYTFITALVEGTTRYNKTDMEAQAKSLDKAITYKHNFLFHCDGNITWSGGTLTWSDKMRIIFISDAGNAIANEINAGNISLSDNEYAYVDLNETNNSSLTVNKASITTNAASEYKGVGRVILGYRNPASDNFYPVAIQLKIKPTTEPTQLPTYTVGTVPTASSWTNHLIYVTDDVGGAVPAFSDGTNWRRVTDRAIVSTT